MLTMSSVEPGAFVIFSPRYLPSPVMAARTLRLAGRLCSAVSRAPGIAIIDVIPPASGCSRRERRRVTSHHPRAEIGELINDERRARVVGLHAAMFGRETKREC